MLGLSPSARLSLFGAVFRLRRTVRGAVRLAGAVAWSATGRGRLPTGGARRRLILFTRYPTPGTTKTRLIPALGPRAAAEVQRRMTERLMRQARRLRRRMPLEIEVRFAGGGPGRVRQWLGRDVVMRPQGAGDLGQKMHVAMHDALREGARSAVIVGTDCPAVDAGDLRRAFGALESADFVLGPAADGGYYLIGLRRRACRLFDGMPWGTAAVLDRTLERAGELGLRQHLLRELRDVDRPSDLAGSAVPSLPRAKPRISVVIAALNEAKRVGEAVEAAGNARNVEVILADGGSRDGTAEVARRSGARVLQASRGRAAQMNAGARAAEGSILLFLHADTLLPPGWDACVRSAMRQPSAVLGAFELGIAGRGYGLRLVEGWVNARSRRTGLPYGDQALFLRAETFRSAGGFPDLPLMDDYRFVRRLRRRGRVVVVPRPVLTSDRRWRRKGVLRTSLTNHLIVAAHRLGVRPRRLARWYRSL